MLDKLTFKNVSGVAEEVDIEKNFELISRLHPHLKNLLIINRQTFYLPYWREDALDLFLHFVDLVLA